MIITQTDFKDSLSVQKAYTLIGQPIYANLPRILDAGYQKALRRISREVGEVTVGLALGSGAAYGFSHIGVLKILEQEGIPVDIICGSSTGAMIAACWAAGFSIEDTEKFSRGFARKISSFSIAGFSVPFRGIMKSRRLENIFKSIFKDLQFCDLKHSLKIVAFDFLKRKTVILENGLVYKAVAASCAFPGIFEPIRVGKNILLDGGVLTPLPTEILLRYNVNKIIASNITLSREQAYREYGKRNKLHIFDFIFGSIESIQQEFIEQAWKITDVVIHPNFEGRNWMEFDKFEEFIKRGEEATLGEIDKIKELVL